MPSFKMLKTLEVTEASETLATAARKRRKGALVLTEKGKPLMVLVPVETGVDLESLSLSMSPAFQALLARSRAQYKPGSGIPLDQMKRQLRVRRRAARKAG
jgi:hypothetical protein